MKNKPPHTPFSTPLSDSAREAERRIRNIFQGKRKRPPLPFLIVGVLVILLCGGLVSCQIEAQQSDDSGLLEDVTLYEAGDLAIAFPNDIYDQLLIFPGEDEKTLVSVYERASYEVAQDDYGENAKGGFLFALTRADQAQYERFLMLSDNPGAEYIARDDAGYFCWETPTDVQLYRSVITDADKEEWQRLNSRVEDIREDFIQRNGLTPFDGWEIFSREFVYDGEHFYASYANWSTSMTLVLSQPVKQGADGIWCVERWYDNATGNGYYCFYMEGNPQAEGITAAEHYQQLQAAADAGQRTELLYPQQAALAWLQNYYRNTDAITVTLDDVKLLRLDFGQKPPLPVPAAVSDFPTLNDETAAVFAAVLEGIYYDSVFPDGHPFDWTPRDADGNNFAVYDVDRDGRPELIVRCTTTMVAGERVMILGYDEEYDTIRIEHIRFPELLTFYDNGVIREGWSHNQTWGWLWPYFILQYDPDSDTYTSAGSVIAWNKDQYEKDFPDHIDADGDGVVYRVCLPDQEWDYFQEDPELYVDGAEYARWRDPYLEGANEVAPVFYTMSRDNIAALKNNTLGKEPLT